RPESPTRTARRSSARSKNPNPAVIRQVEEHPLPDAGYPTLHTDERRTVEARTPSPGLVTPRVIAEEGVDGGVEPYAVAGDLHPSVALAGHLVGDSLADQPAVD